MAYFTFEGKEIYYEVHGQGKPFIVLNGIMMSTGSWGVFVPAFSAHNQLILVDFLDQGRSAKMGDIPYTQETQVEVVRALQDHLSVDCCTILGISYGSEVALQFALKYPQRVERLELFNATARTGAWLGDIGDGWNLAAGNGEAYYLTTIPIIYSPGFYKKNRDWMDNRRKTLVPIFSNPDFCEAMVRLTNSASAYDVSDRIGEIGVPTLVVSCQQDYLVPLEEQEFLVSQIPNAHHVIFPNCGHASMYEQPMLFASIALGFLNNITTKYPIS